MRKEMTIYASEREILEIINKHFGLNEDSIVAMEEIGNQELTMTVGLPSELDGMLYLDKIKSGNTQFKLGIMMNYCCEAGLLEAGKYVIDCTW